MSNTSKVADGHCAIRGVVRGESHWVSGAYDPYQFCAKVYDKGSRFGIDGGRVSKLSVSKGLAMINRKWVVNYDRGWDMKPEAEDDQMAYSVILSYLEQLPPEESEEV